MPDRTSLYAHLIGDERERFQTLGREKLWYILIYLLGLLFFSYPPLIVSSQGTRLLRLDWVLSLPLILYLVSRRQIKITQTSVFALGFLSLGPLSLLTSHVYSIPGFLTVFLQLCHVVGMYVLITNMELTEDDVRIVLRVWVTLVVIAGVYGLYQALTLNLGVAEMLPYTATSANSVVGSYHRPDSVLAEPNFFATVLITAVAVLVPDVAAEKPVVFPHRTSLGLLVFVLGMVLLTQSIAGYLALGFMWIIFAMIPLTRTVAYKFGVVLLGSLAALVAIDVLFKNGIVLSAFERLIRISEILVGLQIQSQTSINVRLARYLAGLSAWIYEPILGVGIGQFSEWVANTDNLGLVGPWASRFPLGALHGAWIQTLALTGTVGFLMFVGIWITCIRDQAAAVRHFKGSHQVLAVIGFILTLTLLFDWSFDLSIVNPLRWVLIAIVYAYTRSEINRRSTRKPQN